MAALDFFAFFPARFLGSEAVKLMTLTERGVYITLMCHAWENDGLPLEVDRIARIVGIPKAEMAEMLAGPLGDCWEERGGRLVNPKLEEERERASEKSGAAKKAAEARWGKKADAPAPEAQVPPPSVMDAPAMHPQCVRIATPDADAFPQDKTRQEHSLTSFESETRARDGLRPAPGEGDGSAVPQPQLERVLAEQVEPVPSAVVEAIREFGAHVGERTGQSRGRTFWRQVLAEALRDPGRFAERAAFSAAKNAKSLLAPSDAELAEWRAGRASDPSTERLTARGAQQRRNEEALERFAARAGDQPLAPSEWLEAALRKPGERRALSGEPAARVLAVEDSTRPSGGGGGGSQRKAAQAEVVL